MSASTSPQSGRPYGVKLVCETWELPRSTFYLQRQREAAQEARGRLDDATDDAPPVTSSPPTGGANDPTVSVPCAPPSQDAVLSSVFPPLRLALARKPRLRPGPKTTVTDERVLQLIGEDILASLWQGEGHRKVARRIAILADAKIGTRRVLRLMREHSLLSPARTKRGVPDPHDGRITTDAPNVMWATDGTRVWTEKEGWAWIFAAVEHWNAECVGLHVVKTGTRFEAMEPIRAGLTRIFGSAGQGVGQGVRLRMDWGSQYRSDAFRRELRYWGIQESFAYVGEPETNGVAERFFRTLKEQAVYGRRFDTVAELSAAMTAFAERYNERWLVQKLGLRTPNQARREWSLPVAA